MNFKQVVKNKTFFNGGLFSFFSLVNQGFSFLILLVLANYISPSEYGYLSLFATVVMVIGYFMALSTEGYLSISYFKEGDIGVKKTVSNIIPTTLLISTFFIVVIYIGGERLANVLNLDSKTLLIAVCVGFFSVYSSLSLDFFRIKENVKVYGIFSCLSAVLNFVLSIYFVKNLSLGWTGRIYSQFLCAFLFGVTGLFLFTYRKQIGLPDIKWWKSMILWGIPLIPHLATTFIKQGMDRYIINSFYPIDEVGLFSFAINLTNIIIMLGDGFNRANSVEIFKVLGDKLLDTPEKECKLLRQKKILLIAFMVIFTISIISIPILLPMFMPKYIGAIKYFIILAFSGLFQCVYFIYVNFLFYYGKTRIIMYVTFSTSVFHLLLSLILTRYSLLLTCSLYCVTQLIVTLLIRKFAIQILSNEGITYK